jgi:hypothetical protein
VIARRLEAAEPAPKAAIVLFVVAATLAAAVFVHRSWLAPDGGWDAWMIWNLRARWLLRAPSLAEAFPVVLPVTHPDYPILLPSLVALGWRVLGESASVPIVLAAAFASLYVSLLVVAVTGRRGRSWGLLAGAILLSTPVFVWSAPAQYADIPLGTFVLLGAIALLRAEEGEGSARTRAQLAAGLALSLAALTKNEGLVYLGSFALAVLLVGGGSFARRARDALWLLLGAAPGLAVLVAFRRRLAPPGEFSSLGAMWQRALDPSRWLLASEHLLRRLVYFQGWTLLLPAAVVAGLLVLRGPAPSSSLRRIGAALGGALLFLATAYVVTPHDIVWHIDNSFDRLLLQAWGTLLLILFLSLRIEARPSASA